MNKLTAEKCKTLIERLSEDKRASRISILGELYLQALEIALPVLEQNEATTDTYRQIENDGWIEWKGGDNPAAGKRIQVQFRKAKTNDAEPSEHYRWYHHQNDYDIIAYRVIGGESC